MTSRTLLIALLAICWSCRETAPSEPLPEVVRLMNVGKAHLENRDSRRAVELFAAATTLAPDSAPPWRNLARAQLLARDEAAALEAVERAASLESPAVATSYLRGLALARLERFAEAREHFETAVRLDPHTAPLRFQLAAAYQALGLEEPAIEQFGETLRLDPLHTSAHYKLMGHARRTGDQQEFALRLHEVTRLRQLFGDDSRSPEALETCVYTRAEALSAAAQPSPPSAEVRFTDTTDEMFSSPAGRASLRRARATAVLDVDEEGLVSLFVAGSDGRCQLILGGGRGFEHRPVDLGPACGLAAVQLIAGDFHNTVPDGSTYDPDLHARTDILLLHAGGAILLQATGPGTFRDVTTKAGLAGFRAHRARWVDYEHDGDLDLVAVGARGVELWQNNGEGTFEEVASAVGIGDLGPAVDVAAADLDGNLGVDLLVARGDLPTLLLENQRTGSFGRSPEPPGPWPAASRVLVDDLDNDGHVDTLLIGAGGATIVSARQPRRSSLKSAGLSTAAAVLLDFDNDGWLDLLVGGRHSSDGERGGLRLWRNDGQGGWGDHTARAGLAAEMPAVHDAKAVDFDADGDTDLLLVTADGLRFWRNDGGNRNGQLKVRLVGTKTNPTGLGTRVEVRRGQLRLARTVSSLPVEIGVGQREPVDTVQVIWTNGIVDNQIDVAIGDLPLTIVEKNVAAGSCPFLYAWDGDRFRFVTDILGNSPLGLSLRRGLPLPADPDELVEIGSPETFKPHRGLYRLQVTEEMRAVLYLDQVRLLAADHPADVEIHSTDKLMPPPFPASELVALGSIRPAQQVLSSDGIPRGEALAAIDGRFAPTETALPPPWRGVTRPLALSLDFGPIDTSRPLVLALTGWLQYGDASTNIALSQASPDRVVPPHLEAETAAGRRLPLDVVVGMPAGKTKTILVDLAGKLPPGTRRLRLTTSVEIRWDRIALGERLAAAAVRYITARPRSARLEWRGFSDIRSRAPGHPTTPEFDRVADRPPWRTNLEGWATRPGDVLELVGERDGEMALVTAGDAVELAFAADEFPPPAAGHSRTFFFYSVGWDKDGDPNVIDGETIEPLPATAASGDEWRLRHNTRWIAGDRFADDRNR